MTNKMLYLFLLAARVGNLEKIREFLESGSDVNATDEDSSTALIEASKFGRFEVVKYLVEKGADLQIKDRSGLTALVYAKKEGSDINLDDERGAVLVPDFEGYKKKLLNF